jgi:hypothetical protein
VTFVNAPLFADERGLSVREISDPHSEDYVSVLRVSGVTRDGNTVRVAGTVVQPGDRERLIEVWDTPVDVEPSEHMAFFRYEDRPGVIGAVGTGFGEAGVNIAAAQVGRRAAGGEAIMALSLDEAVPREVLGRHHRAHRRRRGPHHHARLTSAAGVGGEARQPRWAWPCPRRLASCRCGGSHHSGDVSRQRSRPAGVGPSSAVTVAVSRHRARSLTGRTRP